MHELFLTAERVERTALAELHRAAPETTREQLGLRLETVGTALVSIAAAEPTNILLNRTIGLGIEAPATQDAVKTIVELYAQAGVTDYFVHLHPHAQPAELRDWLAQAGLSRTRGWMKFKRDNAPPPNLQSEGSRTKGAGRAGSLASLIRVGWKFSVSYDHLNRNRLRISLPSSPDISGTNCTPYITLSGL